MDDTLAEISCITTSDERFAVSLDLREGSTASSPLLFLRLQICRLIGKIECIRVIKFEDLTNKSYSWLCSLLQIYHMLGHRRSFQIRHLSYARRETYFGEFRVVVVITILVIKPYPVHCLFKRLLRCSWFLHLTISLSAPVPSLRLCSRITDWLALAFLGPARSNRLGPVN